MYCERTSPGLLNEPLNALSNLGFFIAAYFVYRLIANQRQAGMRSWTLLALIIAIGVGSTLFHTFATRWAMFADTLPIFLFQLFFIFAYTDIFIHQRTFHPVLAAIAYIGLTVLFGLFPRDWLNGSIAYLPALILLIALGIYHCKTQSIEPYLLLIAAGTFATSLGFRTMDMALCDQFPWGLHYVWHSLNGIVLYLVARCVIMNSRQSM